MHTAAWLLDKVPVVIGTGASGSVAAWAAHATAALSAYSPFSWVLAGFLGVLLFLTARLVWASSRIRLLRYRLALEAAEKSDQFNPLDDTFTRKRIDLTLFKTPLNEPIENKTFVDCDLRGPLVVVFQGVTMVGVNIVNCEFVRVREGAQVINVLPFINLRIQGGKIHNLTILVPEGAVGQIPAFANWITP